MNNRRVDPRETKEDVIFIELLASSQEGEAVSISLSSSVDRSPGGIQFSVDDPLTLGLILQVFVETAEGERLILVGEVKWCRPNKEEKNYYIGFEFFDSEGTDIDVWTSLFSHASPH